MMYVLPGARLHGVHGTHLVLLAPICRVLPLIDKLVRRYVRFIGSCLESYDSIVSHVAKHSIYFARMKSPLELNAQFWCNKYNKTLNQQHDRPICNAFVWRHVNSSYSQYVRDTASVISELLSVKSSFMDL